MVAARLLPAALFFLSGCASLIFETLCMRRLALVMGNTVQSASATVSAFLFGLGLGAYLGGVLVRRSRRPLRAFALVECAAGVTGWLVLKAIPALPALLVPLAHQAPSLLGASKLALAFLLLTIPASAMGASLPVLAHYYIESLGAGFTSSLASLYAINTLGAMAGVVLTDFVLVEMFGVSATARVSLALYLLVALLALSLGAKVEGSQPPPEAEPASPDPAAAREGAIILAASGFLGLTFQVLWTRMLSFFNGNDVFAFSTTLAVYLFGLALGSAALGLRPRWREKARLAPLLLLLLGLTAYLSLFSIGWVRQVQAAFNLQSFAGKVTSNFLGSGLVMLASTFCLGLLFPLAAERIRRGGETAGASVGSAYVFNTIGSVLGGLLAGYLLLPYLGLQKSLACASLAAVLLGSILLARSPSLRWLSLLAPLGFAALLWATPGTTVLKTFYGKDYPGIVYHSDDHYGSIALVRSYDPELAQVTENLLVDGFNMAGNTATAKSYTTGLAALPILLNRSAKEVLIVCMGLGNTLNTAVSLTQTERVQCVELSPLMPAMLAKTEVGPRVLASPKLDIAIGDGRNYLLNTTRRFDVISAEPPPPIHAGIVNLYSREYYELCASRLTEDGMLAHWLPVFELSPYETKTIIRAFQDVFPYTYLWQAEDTQLCLLGKKQPLDLDYSRLERAVLSNQEFLAETGWDSASKIAALCLADPEQLRAYTRDIPPLTDDWPLIQYNRSRFGVDTPFFFLDERPRLLDWQATASQKEEMDLKLRGLTALRYYPALPPTASTLERRELARFVRQVFPDDAAFATRLVVTPARLEAAEKDLAARPDNVAALLEIARIRYANNDLPEALVALERASALPGPHQHFARVFAALVLLRSGDREAARAALATLGPGESGPDLDYVSSLLGAAAPRED